MDHILDKRSYMNKILVFLVIVVVVVGGIYYMISKNKGSGMMNPQVATSASVGANGNAGNTAANGKMKSTCDSFKTGMESEYKAGDDSILPAEVAAVGKSETLCGSIASLNTVYYLTDKTDQQIIDLYRNNLTAAGCTFILSVTPVPGREAYSTNYSYQCSEGKIYVSTGFRVNTLFVTFSPPR